MAASQGRQLLPGERVVSSSNMLTLTNYRVFRDSSGSGQSRYISITLDAISSCGLVTNSQPVWIVLGALVGLIGFAVPGDAQAILFIAGVMLIVMYFATRNAVVAVCSTGGERITVPAQPQQRDLLMTLLNAVDQEKLAALGRIDTAQRINFYAAAPPPPTPPAAARQRNA